MKDDQKKNEDYQIGLIEENERLNSEIGTLRGDIVKLQQEKEQVEHAFHSAQKSVQQLTLDLSHATADGAQAEQALKENEIAQQARAEHTRQYDRMIAEYEERLRREQNERDKLLEENLRLNNQLRATEKDLSDTRGVVRKQEKQLQAQDDQIFSLKESNRNREEITQHRDRLLDQLKLFKAEHGQLSHTVDAAKTEFKGATERHQAFFEKVKKDKSEGDMKVVHHESELQKREAIIKHLQQEILKHTAQVHTLEQLLCVKEDIASKLDQMNELTEELSAEKEKL